MIINLNQAIVTIVSAASIVTTTTYVYVQQTAEEAREVIVYEKAAVKKTIKRVIAQAPVTDNYVEIKSSPSERNLVYKKDEQEIFDNLVEDLFSEESLLAPVTPGGPPKKIPLEVPVQKIAEMEKGGSYSSFISNALDTLKSLLADNKSENKSETTELSKVGAVADGPVCKSIPVVTDVSSEESDTQYVSDYKLKIKITFSCPVTVTGTPTLKLNSGVSVFANYLSGSGTKYLIFEYLIASGDISADLDYDSVSALELNSGTIVGDNKLTATLALATPGTASSMGANKAIEIVASFGLSGPVGLAFDSDDNLYFADHLNSRVVALDSTGNKLLWTYTGTLNQPEGVAIDNAGNVLIADLGNNKIVKLNSSGVYLSESPQIFAYPIDVVVDTAGFLYISEYGAGKITKVNPDDYSTVATFATGPRPAGIHIDNSSGALYVAGNDDNQLYKFNADTTLAWNYNAGQWIEGVGQLADGTVIGVNYHAGRLDFLNPTTGTLISSSGAFGASFGGKTNSNNNIYVSLYGAGQIAVLDSTGTLIDTIQ